MQINSIKNILSILLVILLFTQKVFSQQNFFNVPSSDITAKQKLFFQQQINLYHDEILSNTTFTYGLGKNYEIGLNLLGIAYHFDNKFIFHDQIQPYSPMLAVNFQKKIDLSEKLALSIGNHLAINRVGNIATYIYANSVYYNEKTKTKLVLGGYYSSDGYFGAETRNYRLNTALKEFGFQGGIEQNIWQEKILFQADFISGRHTLGQMVLGGAYCLNTNWVASGGYQIPITESVAEKAYVMEITYIPR